MKKRKIDKASVHSGRANSKGVAYNANHNTMEEARINQPHIDQERISQNQYLRYTENGEPELFRGGQGGFNARQHEKQRYEEVYGEGIKARNERYTKSGHKERARAVNQVYRDPKTCPMEIIFQVGKQGSETDKELRTCVLMGAWGDTWNHFKDKFGENMVPLDCALHRDETNDHIHFRFTLGARDKFGHMVPNQSAALEAMGFDGRNPETGKKDRYHNPLVAFTDEVREVFYQACERRGIEIDREVTSGSRRQLELLEQKRNGLERELAATEQQRQATVEAAQRAKKSLDNLEAKQLLVEMEVEEQQRKAAEAVQSAENARQAAEQATRQAAQAKAAEAAIREQARYEAENTVRELQAQLWEKDSIIHSLQAETAKLKAKLSKIREYLLESNILDNFLHWVKGRSQQQNMDDREL